MRIRAALSVSLAIYCCTALAQRNPPTVNAEKYLYGKNLPAKVLQHVRIIDGTGAPVAEDQTIVIEGKRIAGVGKNLTAPVGAEILDLRGYTVLPGLVGMHDHIYYLQRPNADAVSSEGPTLLPQMTFSAPRMYLANGVTTIRTAGSVEPYADINLRRLIDAGRLIGPHVEPTAPYLQGVSDVFMQMHSLNGPKTRKHS